jgi:mannitol-1-/sugar-/sorbitol-6-/2-deoxyglucose-6-phosphatase
VIKAVIYDMDGVLINSEPFWYKAEQEVFPLVNVNLNDKLCSGTAGMRIDEVIEHWYERYPWDNYSKESITQMIIDKMVYFISNFGEPLSGVISSLEYFKTKGYKIALASSSSYVLIDAVLNRLNIREYFDMIHSAQEETHGKPHPAVFLSAANKLGVAPTQCLVIEDTVNGMIAGLAAKMKVIAIPEEINKEDKRFLAATYILDSLEEVKRIEYL